MRPQSEAFEIERTNSPRKLDLNIKNRFPDKSECSARENLNRSTNEFNKEKRSVSQCSNEIKKKSILYNKMRMTSDQLYNSRIESINGTSITFSERPDSNRNRSIDNHSMMLPNKKFLFGIADYNPPRIPFLKDSIKLAKSKEFLPSPDKYPVQDEWIRKNKRLQFSKLARITYSEIAIKQSPRTPGPGEYNPHPVKKKYKDPNLTSSRELGFINEAVCKGENNPLSFDSKFNLVFPKTCSPNFKHYSKTRDTKLVKKDGVTSPTSYDPLESFKKTQDMKRTFKFALYKIPCMTDVMAKVTKDVPGPGSYNHEAGRNTFYKPFYKLRR